MAFATLRAITEQLDSALGIFDSLDVPSQGPTIPQIEDLPDVLEKSNNLARIDRYLGSLEEFITFFIAVRKPLQIDTEQQSPSKPVPAFASSRVNEAAEFEAARAREKIQHEQRLCQTYMRQYDTLVQLVISYSAMQITKRLDQGQKLAGQCTKIGMFLAGLAGIVAPLSLLTGFYA